MVNVAKKGRRRLTICIVCVAVCALLIAPTAAYAFWYVHAEDNTENSTATGAMEVLVTLDTTAQGGGVYAGQIFIPDGGTVADALEEAIHSSEDQDGLEAIHNYDYVSLSEFLADVDYTIMVYSADSQAAGTQTTYDSDGTEADETTVLERYDSVVFTLN